MLIMICVFTNLERKVPFINYYKVNIRYLKLCKQLNSLLTIFTCYAKSFIITYKYFIHVEQNATFFDKDYFIVVNASIFPSFFISYEEIYKCNISFIILIPLDVLTNDLVLFCIP